MAFILFACNGANKQALTEEISDAECIVVFGPDKKELKKINVDYTSDDYFQLLSLNSDIQKRAIKYANKKKIKYIISDKHIYVFRKANGNLVTIDRDKQESKWGLILFDVNKDPVLKTGSEPEFDVRQYFDTK